MSDARNRHGAMLTARRGVATILLKYGTVLVAGGEAGGAAANTLEMCDPAGGRFEQVSGITAGNLGGDGH